MGTTPEATAKPEALPRRQLLIAAAGAAVVIAAGAGGYYLWTKPEPINLVPSGEFSVADLMTPGPLGDMELGNPNAPVTIIEYASMTCPHCAHFAETVYPDLKTKYI